MSAKPCYQQLSFLIENVFTLAQKSRIIAKLTDAMVSIVGENMRPVTWVMIKKHAAAIGARAGRP